MLSEMPVIREKYYLCKRKTVTRNKNMHSPQKLSLRRMYRAFVQMDGGRTKHMFFADNFGVVIDAENVLRPFILEEHVPYMIEDYRLVYCKKGSIRTIINLQEYTIQAGMLAVIVPGTIAEPISISSDCTVTGIGVSEERMLMAHHRQLPGILSGHQSNFYLKATEEELQLVEQLYAMVWSLVNDRQVKSETHDCMLTVVTHTYDDIFSSHAKDSVAMPGIYNRQQEMYQNFIALVNEHCRTERQLDFYADRLCVTKRYLGVVVHDASGVTAKEWIDRAVVTAAKLMLRHTDMSVAQIADKLHFSTDSFFCKYFRRLAGCTPSEWRTASKADANK